MSDQRIRILFIDHGTELERAELPFLSLIAALDRDQFAVEFACSEDGPLASAVRGLDYPVHFVRMQFGGVKESAVGLLNAGTELAKLCAERAIELIHANTLPAGYAAARAAKIRRLPLVWHIRDIDYPRLGRWTARRRAAHIITNSKATATAIGCQEKITVIYDGVEPAFFAEPHGDVRESLRRELALPQDTLLLVTIIRSPSSPHDGLAEVVRAVAKLIDTPHLVVIGSEQPELLAHAAELGLEHRVHFVEPSEDLADIVGGCDILLYPTDDPSALGTATAQAAAAGVPAIASAVGAIEEFIEDGENGWVVEPRNIDAITGALNRLCEDEDLRRQLGTAARATARHQFTVPSHVDAITRVYLRAMSREPA